MRSETETETLAAMLAGRDDAIVAAGHTHVQMLRRHGRQMLVNPGSVGLAYDPAPPAAGVRCVPRAEFALIDSRVNAVSVQFHRVSYDPEVVFAAAFESGMPHADWWVRLWQAEV